MSANFNIPLYGRFTGPLDARTTGTSSDRPVDADTGKGMVRVEFNNANDATDYTVLVNKDGTDSGWVPLTTGGATLLRSLTDVAIAQPSTGGDVNINPPGSVLTLVGSAGSHSFDDYTINYSADQWIAKVPELNSLRDVTLPTLGSSNNGQVLTWVWDSPNLEGSWKQVALPVQSLGMLSDVTLPSVIQAESVLMHEYSTGSTGFWQPVPIKKVAFRACCNSRRFPIAANTDTPMKFNTIVHNVGSGYFTSSDCHFAVPHTGVYSFSFRALFYVGTDDATDGSIHMKLRTGPTLSSVAATGSGGSWVMNAEANQVDFYDVSNTGQRFITMSFHTEVQLASDDCVRPFFRTNSASTFMEANNHYNIGSFNEFSGHLICPTFAP